LAERSGKRGQELERLRVWQEHSHNSKKAARSSMAAPESRLGQR
jgi:hypothetical protein